MSNENVYNWFMVMIIIFCVVGLFLDSSLFFLLLGVVSINVWGFLLLQKLESDDK